jgi:deazaflavin-dependent oxidoreductase (nitroreductase family)
MISNESGALDLERLRMTNSATPNSTPQFPVTANPGTPDSAVTARYLEPDAMTRRVANPLVSGLVKIGVGVRGARILEVRGRTSGKIRSVPVNPLPLNGERYLVAPRGETQWVRNIRAANSADLRKGSKRESIGVTEMDDADKAPIIRAYLELWAMEVGKFFDGLTKDSPDTEIEAVAPGFPVFCIHSRT